MEFRRWLEHGVWLGQSGAMKSVAAEKAAELFPAMLDTVMSTGESYQILVKGGPGAYLVPAAASYPNTHELAEILGASELSSEDERSLAAGLRQGRAALKPLRSPWD